MKTLKEELVKELHNYFEILNLSTELAPEIDIYNNNGRPFILSHCTHFEYVVQENNMEHRRENYNTKEELLYQVMKDIISDDAAEYELKNRIEGQDFRIIWFNRQVELMSKINLNWAERLKNEIKKIFDFTVVPSASNEGSQFT